MIIICGVLGFFYAYGIYAIEQVLHCTHFRLYTSFAIQQNFAWLVNLPEDSVVEKSNNMELY